MTRLLVVVVSAIPLASQTLEIHSEFLRVDPWGQFLSADATPHPREILSPAVVRNGFASFHIVVRSSRTNYFLFVGTNPPDVLRTAVYKEQFMERDGTWFPDALNPVPLPDFGVIPDPEGSIPGQSARVYLLDVWVPPETPPGIVRLEVQLKTGSWIVRPMEVRVLNVSVPPMQSHSPEPLPGVEKPAVESAMAPVLQFLEKRRSAREPGKQPPRTVRAVIRRNAEQDMALAETLNPGPWQQKLTDRASGGEWYLSVRNLIYRLASDRIKSQ